MTHYTPARDTVAADRARGFASDEPILREIASQLYAGRWKIVGCAAVCAGLAAAYLVTADKAYTATASVQLDIRQTQLLDVGSMIRGAASEQVEVSTEIELLQSSRVVGRVVDRFDMARDPEFNAELQDVSLVGGLKLVVKGAVCAFSLGLVGCGASAPSGEADGLYAFAEEDVLRTDIVAAVAERMSVEPIEGTYHVGVGFTSEDPRKAALIANALAEEFLADKLEAKREQLDDAIAYLERQTVELQEKLESAGQELETFRSDEGVIEDTVLAATNARLIEARDRLESAEREKAMLESQVAAAAEAHASGEYGLAAEALASQLVQTLFVEYLDLRRRSEAGEAPAGRQVAAAEAELSNAIVGQIERRSKQVETFGIRMSSLEEIIRLLEADAARQSLKTVRAQRLAEEVEATRATYQTVLLRLRELSVDRALQTEGGRITSRATTPEKPSSPKTMLVLALGLFAGVAAGLGWTIVGEQLARGLRTKADLTRASGAAALGAIPIIRARSISRAFLRDLARSSGSRVGEAMRSFRTFITLETMKRGASQTIAVTSSVASEGKSTSTLLLASVLATSNRRVVVVDADLRNPTLKRLIPSRGVKGLRAYLTGGATLEEIVIERQDLDFHMIIAESGSENAADILSGERFAALIEGLKVRYDIVLVDCPPVLPVADARIIAPLTDGVLYAVQWNATSERVVEEATAILRDLGIPLLGAFYTQVDESDYARFEFGYGGEYRRTAAKYYGT